MLQPGICTKTITHTEIHENAGAIYKERRCLYSFLRADLRGVEQPSGTIIGGLILSK